MKNLLRLWGPLYIYAAVIFYMSNLPKPLPSIAIPYIDKPLHIIEYAIFGLLAGRAFKYSPRRIFYNNFKTLAILLSLLYGMSDEVHQIFVPQREFSVFDILADTLGGALGAIIYGRYNPV